MKLCECGCGGLAPIAKWTNSKLGHIKGQPVRFINHHQPNGWVEIPLAKRFWARVNKSGAIMYPKLGRCWEWLGTCNDKGYGRLYFAGRTVLASHIVWFLKTGRWPKPNALHKCDNPLCVRFSHLFEGTHQDNAEDKVRKGRHRYNTVRNALGRFA